MVSRGLMPNSLIESVKEKPGLWWLPISFIVFYLDQLTKSMATETLKIYEAVHVNTYLNWTLMHNEGMAFSFLADQSGWQRWVIGFVAVIIVIWLLIWLTKTTTKQKFLNLGLVFVIGGALGNIYDRFALGYVIDFIEAHYNEHYWPAFNVADTAISLGAFFLILDLIFGPKDENKSS